MNLNQKRKPQDQVETLAFSNEVAPFQMVSKKLKKSGRLVIEMKMDKKWVGSSQSLHESLTLLSQSSGQHLGNMQNAQNFLHTSLNQSDFMMGVSEIYNQCTLIKGVVGQDQGCNIVKLYMQPNKDFNYEKTYNISSNIEIKSTQYTDNDSIQYDQQIGSDCFYFHDQNLQVGDLTNDEGM